MLRAILFDFNGVILNDEPVHFRSMQAALRGIGIEMTEHAYWNEYLPLDDARCLEKACRLHGLSITEEQRRMVLEDKSRLYRELLGDRCPLFPGALELVTSSAGRFPLGIASGARREEILSALSATGIRGCFRVVLGAEDFATGKPHPESYLFALARLNAAVNGGAGPVRPGECLVIEDSKGGVEGCRAAGMVCLAVTNTYPREKLVGAHRVVDSLTEVGPDDLERMFEGVP
jgi:HAD superfamily hydrolase (TIGR01509 family)